MAMTDISRPPAIYTPVRWAILASCCLAGASFQLAAMPYTPLLGEIAKDLGVELSQSVQLMTYFVLFASLSFFIGGPFVDRLGAAMSIIVSITLAFIPTLATLWVGHSYAAVVAIRVLQGCSVGFCMAGIVPLVMQWFPPQERSLALGITGAFVSLGSMLSVIIAPVIFTAINSWKLTMAYISIIPFAALIYCLVIFRLSRGKAPVLTNEPREGENPGENLLKSALVSRLTWCGIAITFMASWLMQTVFGLTPSYLSESIPVGLGLGPMVGGGLTAIMQVASIIAPVIGGFVAGKYYNGRPGSIIVMGAILVISYGALQFGVIYNTRVFFVLFLILPGMGIGMLMPMLQAKIAELYEPRIVGRMNGLWLGIGSFGGTAGLFVSAKVIAATGAYVAVINMAVLVAFIGLVLAVILNRNKFYRRSV